MGPMLRLFASLIIAKRFPGIFRAGLLYKVARNYMDRAERAPARVHTRR